MFLSVPSAPAQERQGGGFGLIQTDYDNYARLFREGREPSLSPDPDTGSPRWRALYRNHRWADFAAGGEFREPMLAAQTLMGIYLVEHVDHRLSYQIDTIILAKPLLNRTMAESVVLDRLSIFMNNNPEIRERAATGGMTFYSEREIERIARDIDPLVRRRITAGVPRNVRSEVVNIQNMFRQRERGWIATYRFMREKMLVLDGVRNAFEVSTNWAPGQREEVLRGLMEGSAVQRMVEEQIRDIRRANAGVAGARGNIAAGGGVGMWGDGGDMWGDGGDMWGGEEGGPMPLPFGGAPQIAGMTEEEIEELREELTRSTAEGIISEMDSRSSVHKYIVGVYQSTDYHLDTLFTIHDYLHRAANAGDPIAQYHLALFLRFLGDFIGIDPAEALSENQRWLHRASLSDVTRDRVRQLNEQLAAEAGRAERLAQSRQERIGTLVRVEHEKIDLIHEVLTKIADRAGTVTARENLREERAFTMAQERERTRRAVASATALGLALRPNIIVTPSRRW